jgi:hypothetical protein
LLNRPRRPSSRGFNPSGYPSKLLVSYRNNRQFSRWNLPPLVIRAFGAHCKILDYRLKHRPRYRQKVALLISKRDFGNSRSARFHHLAVVWHAQTEKTYRGLKAIADRLKFANLTIVYDPN